MGSKGLHDIDAEWPSTVLLDLNDWNFDNLKGFTLSSYYLFLSNFDLKLNV